MLFSVGTRRSGQDPSNGHSRLASFLRERRYPKNCYLTEANGGDSGATLEETKLKEMKQSEYIY